MIFMGKRGPRPKTERELKTLGTFRADFHGARGENVGYPKSRPEPARQLTAEEREIWDHVCANVPEDLLSAADRDSLTSLCWWQCYAESLKAKLALIPDPKLHRMHKDAHGECRLLWAKFGLTPVDRARMLPTGPPKEDKPDDPISQILRLREGKRKPG